MGRNPGQPGPQRGDSPGLIPGKNNILEDPGPHLEGITPPPETPGLSGMCQKKCFQQRRALASFQALGGPG
jgi:hypothetical protein